MSIHCLFSTCMPSNQMDIRTFLYQFVSVSLSSHLQLLTRSILPTLLTSKINNWSFAPTTIVWHPYNNNKAIYHSNITYPSEQFMFVVENLYIMSHNFHKNKLNKLTNKNYKLTNFMLKVTCLAVKWLVQSTIISDRISGSSVHAI